MQNEVNKYTLPVGSTVGMYAYLTRNFFVDFSKNYPNISLDFLESPDHTIWNYLLDDRVELAILGGFVNSNRFISLPFAQFYPYAVLSKHHPLSKKKYLRFKDLENQPLIIGNRELLSHEFIVNHFRKKNIGLNIVVETAEIDFLHKLASQNEGIGISFDSYSFDNIPDNTVVRPFEDKNFVWQTYIVYQQITPLSREAKTFLNFLLDWHKNHASELTHWSDPYEDYNFIHK